MNNNEVVEVAGFESNTTPVNLTTGDVAISAREQHEIQAAIISAKRFPRDEAASYVKAMKSFQRPTLADNATYCFPRSGTKISGPSIDCARELARCWGNIRYGIRLIANEDKQIHIKCFAFDLESNNYIEAEDRFEKLVQRKGRDGLTKWIEPDERDLRELIFRRGAILVRNCILQILPPDLIDDALRVAEKTLLDANAGKLKQNREDAIRRIVFAFDSIGVSSGMLEKKLGHDLAVLTEQELTELQGIYRSLKDGHSARHEHFEFVGKEEQFEAMDLNAKLKGNLKDDKK